MTSVLLRNIGRFALLITIQVLILNKVQFSNYINPYLYILCIMMLPFNMPRWTLLFIGFGLGFTIDIFTDTSGMHASATTFMAFCRPYILNSVLSKDKLETEHSPNMTAFGFSWFLSYAIIMTLLHHSFLFIIEIFNFKELGLTFSKIILSTFFTVLMIFISIYIFPGNKKRL